MSAGATGTSPTLRPTALTRPSHGLDHVLVRIEAANRDGAAELLDESTSTLSIGPWLASDASGSSTRRASSSFER
jgi:hypothetical protein